MESLRIGGVSQGNCPTDAKLPGLSGLQPRRDLRPPPPPARPCGAKRRVRESGSLAGVMTPTGEPGSPDYGLSVENLVVAGGEAKVAPHSPGSVRSVSRGGLTLEGSGKR